MKKIIIIAALLLSATAQASPTEEQCSAAASIAAGALEWRQAGITEDVAMEFLRHQNVYSGLPVWAVKQAYSSPDNVPKWMLRGAVFNECLERVE